MDDEIRYPSGFGLKDIVSWGNSGFICLDEATHTVVKIPHDETNRDSLMIEERIYQRLKEHGTHRGLLQYYGPYESGIRLEYACNQSLGSFICKNTDIDSEHRMSWAKQIIDALCFVHSLDIIHGDLTANNIFLTKELDAKVADFGGSSLDGSELLVAVAADHRYPGPALSIQNDIFALGSTLYEIMTGKRPYHGRGERDIRTLYQNSEFPPTKPFGPIGRIITKCWEGKYSSTDSIRKDIEGMIDPVSQEYTLGN